MEGIGSKDASGTGFAANPLSWPAPQTREAPQLRPHSWSGATRHANRTQRRREARNKIAFRRNGERGGAAAAAIRLCEDVVRVRPSHSIAISLCAVAAASWWRIYACPHQPHFLCRHQPHQWTFDCSLSSAASPTSSSAQSIRRAFVPENGYVFSQVDRGSAAMHIAIFFLDDYTLGMEGVGGIPIEGYRVPLNCLWWHVFQDIQNFVYAAQNLMSLILYLLLYLQLSSQTNTTWCCALVIRRRWHHLLTAHSLPPSVARSIRSDRAMVPLCIVHCMKMGEPALCAI